MDCLFIDYYLVQIAIITAVVSSIIFIVLCKTVNVKVYSTNGIGDLHDRLITLLATFVVIAGTGYRILFTDDFIFFLPNTECDQVFNAMFFGYNLFDTVKIKALKI